MTYVLAFFAALAGLILGWLVAAFGTLILGSAFGLRDFEGERAMVAFFGIGPVGGVIGLALGIWLWRKLRARP